MTMTVKRPEDRYDSLFQFYSTKWGVHDWRLLKAQALAESNLDPDAVSPVGAKGLAQFMPPTWQEWWDRVYGARGLPRGPRTNPERSIELQAAYMRQLLDVFQSVNKALAAYNWGWGRVRRHLQEWGGSLAIGHLPEETRTYIQRVGRLRENMPPCGDPSSG